MSENQKDINKEGYRTAFKSTSIYGGVQVITIIIGIIRTKIAAIYLGTSGFGILGVFTTSINLFVSVSNLGFSSSAVREISRVSVSEDDLRVAELSKAISRWVIITGFIGTILMILLSVKLSVWTFDNSSYVYSYVAVSIVILLTNIYSGHYALLQGLRRIKDMAFAKIIGSILGLIVVVPCYILGGIQGIVPSLILSTTLSLVISLYFSKKIHLPKVKLDFRQTISIGRTTLILGLMMMLTSLMVNLTELITKSYITSVGGLSDVGLYQASWAINTQYLGLVFTAMATDYFPRLTQIMGIKNNTTNINSAVNQQSEIALIILIPLICVMLIFLPTVIQLLYTKEFIAIVPMTKLLLIGALIKAGSWAISYMFLSAGDGKVYIFNEVAINLISLPLYLISYSYGGLIAIGYAFIVIYSIYFSWVLLIAYRKYRFRFSDSFLRILTLGLVASVLTANLDLIDDLLTYVIVTTVLLLVIIVFSYIELNNRIKIDFRKMIKKGIKR